MANYIKRAIKDAAEFNAQLAQQRREERCSYFDMQTQVKSNCQYMYLPTNLDLTAVHEGNVFIHSKMLSSVVPIKHTKFFATVHVCHYPVFATLQVAPTMTVFSCL